MFTKMRETDMDTFRSLVKRAQGDLLLTQFADHCNVSASTISRILKGQTTTPSTDDLVVKLALNAQKPSVHLFRLLVYAQGYGFPGEDNWDETARYQRYADAFLVLKIRANPELYQKASEMTPKDFAGIMKDRFRDNQAEAMDAVTRTTRYPSSANLVADFWITEKDTEHEKNILRGFNVDTSCDAISATLAFYKMAMFMGHACATSKKSDYDSVKFTLIVCYREVYDVVVQSIKSTYCPVPKNLSLMLVDVTKANEIEEYTHNYYEKKEI